MLRGEVQDLKSFCPEAVDCFLTECEELINAINTRQQLGDWETCVVYQELLHEKLNRLANVADMQAYYGDVNLQPAQSTNTALSLGSTTDSSTGVGANIDISAQSSSKSSLNLLASGSRSSPIVIVGPSGPTQRWKKEEREKLKEAVKKYGNPLDPKDPNALSSLPLIANYVLTKSESQCKEKIIELQNGNLID
mmetsp:Transcript_13039/g.16211  ORF Transcript_13039/g.16211 Transcript_13039/m.16211 type:complete len:194 (+) Transcript_13039:197-778(+)